MKINFDSKIYIAGHRGLVGSSILKKFKDYGFKNILTKTSKQLDLRNQNDVNQFFNKENIEFVILAAAKVGGISANNKFRAEFIYDNLIIQSNVIHASYLYGIKKLLFLGSSCIYPKHSIQPLKEEYLLDGKLEETNRPYSIAKIAGIELCSGYRRQYGCNFISVMPTNIYGPNDNFDLQTSHVFPALIRKFCEAKNNNSDHITLWGTGNPRREFLHSDDLASACLFLIKNYDEEEIINVGWGKDISIKELADIISNTVGFKGKILFDTSKPDGTFQKVLDCSKIYNLGWKPNISLLEGVKSTVNEYNQRSNKI
tara:strand:+ start:6059 stop:7000 length:942 start_codon:yes stop_codon:yes gene_type:complete